MQTETLSSTFIEKSFSDIVPIHEWGEAIKAGRFQDVDSWLTPENTKLIKREPAPVNPSQFSVINFGKDLIMENVFEEIKKMNHVPGLASELLGYLALHPEEEKLSPIVAPGSPFFDRYGLPSLLCFSLIEGKRSLFLACTHNAKGKDRVFDGRFRFLVKTA